MAKWFRVCFRTGCGFKSRCSHLNFKHCASFEQRVPCIQTTTKYRFTLKRIYDMIRTDSPYYLNLINLKLVKTFDGNEDLTQTKIIFLSSLHPFSKACENQGLRTGEIGNEESFFLSAIEIMSVLPTKESV